MDAGPLCQSEEPVEPSVVSMPPSSVEVFWGRRREGGDRAKLGKGGLFRLRRGGEWEL